jgi:hypothetical protein
MPVETTTVLWLRRMGIVIIGLLAAVGLWSLIQQVVRADPCPHWVTIGSQGLDLCRVVSWEDNSGFSRNSSDDFLYVWMQAGGSMHRLKFYDKDREALLPLLPRGQAR